MREAEGGRQDEVWSSSQIGVFLSMEEGKRRGKDGIMREALTSAWSGRWSEIDERRHMCF